MSPSRARSPASLPEFLAAVAERLGAEHVVTDAAALERAMTATYATTARVPAIVRPGSTAEVQACLLAANRLGVPVYPTSRGKNWGFGSRVPASDGAVLLDLGRMNRVVDFDEALAHVTVEPGVSFADLHAFLGARGSRLFASTVGAGPHASVLANALERGDGSGPLGDRWSHVCALEVVLPTGEVIHTGPDRFEGAKSASVARWGPGPALDGLFSQSNLGVVTRMTVWLAPLPRSLTPVRFSVVDPARLPALVDACRALRLEGTLRAMVGIWNDYRVLSTVQQYPWEATGGATPLRREQLARLRTPSAARWFGSTAVYAATASEGRAALARVANVLRPLVDHISAETRTGAPTSGHELFATSDPAIAFLQGIPHKESLHSLYWRKRMPIPPDVDPDRDRCGAIWTAVPLPFEGRATAEVASLLEDLLLDHGFEPMIAMVAQTDRMATIVPLILYDRDVAGADAQATACRDAVIAALARAGYPLGRLGVGSMDALPAPTDAHGALMARLKRALDPNDILAPGRYDFRGTWPTEREG
jgi:4-cresol dehydrogenase (hydroxylating)